MRSKDVMIPGEATISVEAGAAGGERMSDDDFSFCLGAIREDARSAVFKS